MRFVVPCLLLSLMYLPACGVPRLPGRSFTREDLTRYYAENAGVSTVPVGRVRVHDGGPAIKSAFFDAIGKARGHVLVDSFLLNDGPEVRPVLDALARKERQGVKVRLIGDASSRFVPEEAAFDYLEKVRVPHVEFHPFGPAGILLVNRLLERDHRKFWVVDGRHVLLGGANLSELSLRAPELGGNLDLMVGIESPEAAAELTRTFVGTWNESSRGEKLEVGSFPVATDRTEEKGRVWLFNQDPHGAGESMTGAMMNGLYASARRSLWLIQPYTFVNPQILRPLRQLVRRGVEVNVVLSAQTKAPRFRQAAFYGMEELLDAGARVWVTGSEFPALHYKCVLVDGELAYVGSANLNWRSYHLSRELGVVFDDPAAVNGVRQVVDRVRAHCRLVSRSEAKKYRTPWNYAIWLAMQSGG